MATKPGQQVTESTPRKVVDQDQMTCGPRHFPEQVDRLFLVQMVKEKRAAKDVVSLGKRIAEHVEVEVRGIFALRACQRERGRAVVAPIHRQIEAMSHGSRREGRGHITAAACEIENPNATGTRTRKSGDGRP